MNRILHNYLSFSSGTEYCMVYAFCCHQCSMEKYLRRFSTRMVSVMFCKKKKYMSICNKCCYSSSYVDNVVSKYNHNSLDCFNKFDESLRTELEELNPTLLPSYSNDFASYVSSSKLLQLLLTFGVDLAYVQKNYPESLRFLTVLDYNKEIKPKLLFLKSNGVTVQEFGDVLTKYIMILDPNIQVEQLQQRYQY